MVLRYGSLNILTPEVLYLYFLLLYKVIIFFFQKMHLVKIPSESSHV